MILNIIEEVFTTSQIPVVIISKKDFVFFTIDRVSSCLFYFTGTAPVIRRYSY